jgi:S-adenosylmethionine uptake transporter
MKLALGELPLFQSIFLRGILATALVGTLALRSGAFRAVPRGRDALLAAVRTLGEIGGTVFYLSALAAIGLATTMSIFQVVPLGVTLVAALFFGEHVGWRRALAVLAGFAGVLLIVRPGTEAFHPAALFALVAVCFVVGREFATRALSAGVSSLFVTFATAAAITVTGAIGALSEDWQPVAARHWLWFAGSSVFLAIGYYSSVTSMRVGDASFSSPFRYTGLVWAILLGIAVFGEVPDAMTVIGGAVVVASGLYTVWRERVRARGG